MKFFNTFILAFTLFTSAPAQLSIEQIMADPKESVGALPSNPFWSEDGKTLYFSWNPKFNQNEDKVLFTKNNNLYSIEIATGELAQLTNFQTGSAKPELKLTEQEKWLKQDQMSLFDILKERADKKKETEKSTKGRPRFCRADFVDG